MLYASGVIVIEIIRPLAANLQITLGRFGGKYLRVCDSLTLNLSAVFSCVIQSLPVDSAPVLVDTVRIWLECVSQSFMYWKLELHSVSVLRY